MSLNGALTAGFSGLVGQSRALGHISENVSNATTNGYKRIETRFETLVSVSRETRHMPGGVRAYPYRHSEVQGDIKSSEEITNLAISGRGFFSVSRQAGEADNLPIFENSQYYTRTGNFAFDQNGYLKNIGGYYLNGWPVSEEDGVEVIDRSSVQPIRLESKKDAPTATSVIEMGANLPAGVDRTQDISPETTEDPPAGNSAEGDPINLSSIPTQIYDPLGGAHMLSTNWSMPTTKSTSLTGEVTETNGELRQDQTNNTTYVQQNVWYAEFDGNDFSFAPKVGALGDQTMGVTVNKTGYKFEFYDDNDVPEGAEAGGIKAIYEMQNVAAGALLEEQFKDITASVVGDPDATGLNGQDRSGVLTFANVPGDRSSGANGTNMSLLGLHQFDPDLANTRFYNAAPDPATPNLTAARAFPVGDDTGTSAFQISENQGSFTLQMTLRDYGIINDQIADGNGDGYLDATVEAAQVNEIVYVANLPLNADRELDAPITFMRNDPNSNPQRQNSGFTVTLPDRLHIDSLVETLDIGFDHRYLRDGTLYRFTDAQNNDQSYANVGAEANQILGNTAVAVIPGAADSSNGIKGIVSNVTVQNPREQDDTLPAVNTFTSGQFSIESYNRQTGEIKVEIPENSGQFYRGTYDPTNVTVFEEVIAGGGDNLYHERTGLRLVHEDDVNANAAEQRAFSFTFNMNNIGTTISAADAATANDAIDLRAADQAPVALPVSALDSVLRTYMGARTYSAGTSLGGTDSPPMKIQPIVQPPILDVGGLNFQSLDQYGRLTVLYNNEEYVGMVPLQEGRIATSDPTTTELMTLTKVTENSEGEHPSFSLQMKDIWAIGGRNLTAALGTSADLDLGIVYAEPNSDLSETVPAIEVYEDVKMGFGVFGQADNLTQWTGDRIDFLEVSQNGFPPGSFRSVDFDRTGFMTVSYDNGRMRRLYQTPLARFDNPPGLQAEAGNAFSATRSSGTPLLDQPTAAGLGGISGSSVEQSNVDIAEEFSNLIITNRVYSANARIVTTSDTLLEETINLVR